MDQMREWDFIPFGAADGKEAQGILSTNDDIKLVITDMRMPEMSGTKLAKAIKSKHKNISIIILSTVKDEIKKKHADLFSSILSKPVKQHHL